MSTFFLLFSCPCIILYHILHIIEITFSATSHTVRRWSLSVSSDTGTFLMIRSIVFDIYIYPSVTCSFLIILPF